MAQCMQGKHVKANLCFILSQRSENSHCQKYVFVRSYVTGSCFLPPSELYLVLNTIVIRSAVPSTRVGR